MFVIFLFALGLCAGSFIGAFTWRIHQKKDWVHDRSVCEHCGHTLAAKDLIPLISWLSLGSMCRYCHKPIGMLMPLLEITTALLFAGSYVCWPYGFASASDILLFSAWLVILIGLLALAVYDARWMLLPDKMVYPLTAFGVLWAGLVAWQQQNTEVFGWAIISAGLFFGLFYLLFQLSGGKWIGGGDVKLSVLLGLLVGTPAMVFLTIFLASLLGSVVGTPLVLIKGKKASHKVPFGPFLIAATVLVILFGAALIDWYKKQFSLI